MKNSLKALIIHQLYQQMEWPAGLLKEVVEKAGGILNLTKADSKSFANLTVQRQNAILALRKMDAEKIDQELCRENIEILEQEDKDYPKRLREMVLPPSIIYVKGRKEILKEASLAVVGSRKMSSYGKTIGLMLLNEVTRKGVVSVSGLAIGVDTLVHEISVNLGVPTIAVLGSGLDWESIYPKNNVGLAQKIIEGGGCLVSEYPPLSKPLKHHFIARNRIIAGLSCASLVLEAGKKSGALITANFALEENREVLAVPGAITSPNSEGTNELIKNGAKVVLEPRDILETLGIEETQNRHLELVGEERKLLELIENGTGQIEQILAQSRLGEPEILALLTQLEIKQAIIKSPEGDFVAL